MKGAVHDLGESFRLLARDRRFSVAAVLLLGLTAGATTAVFSAFDALLLRPLQVRRPESLVRVVEDRVRLGARSQFRYSVVRALSHARGIEGVAATHQRNAGYVDGNRSERVRIELASESYFALFEARAQAGRLFGSEDGKPSEGTPAVLSFPFWQRRYRGDARVLGRTVRIQNFPVTIVGVAHKPFHGATIENCPDVWLPIEFNVLLYPDAKVREENVPYEIVARLREGVSPGRARDEAYGLYRATMEKDLADADAGARAVELSAHFRLEAIPRGVSRLREQFSGAMRFLMASAGVLFVMGATSAAGLLLARFASRSREFATRLALGASPARLVRLAAFESLLLSAGGAILGALLAAMLTRAIPRALPPVRLLDATTVPLTLRVETDGRALAFICLAMLATSLLMVLASSMSLKRAEPGNRLRGVRTATGRVRGRFLLVVLQAALSTALLVVAAQLVFTLRNLREVDPGFATAGIVSFAVDPSLAGKDDAEMGARIELWKEQVKNIPGVRAACLSSRPLLHGTGFKTTVAPAGQRAPLSEFMNASSHAVSAEYFETLGLRFLEGRNFRPDEFRAAGAASGEPEPRIVNQAFVERFFPEGAAVGKLFGIGVSEAAKPQYRIVGVVTNAKYRSLREPVPPTLYAPLHGYAPGVLHVRTAGLPAPVMQPVRELLRRIAPELPIHEVSTMEQDVEASLAGEKVVAALAAVFGSLAVLIVAAGLFGLISFLVTERTREIGIRIALGARPANIVRLVSTHTVALVGAGVALGLACSWAVGELLVPLLYGVPAHDRLAWSAAVMVMAAVGAVASVAPPLKALRIEPATALRVDR